MSYPILAVGYDAGFCRLSLAPASFALCDFPHILHRESRIGGTERSYAGISASAFGSGRRRGSLK